MISILTGPIHSGKTSILSALVSELTEHECRCAGILSKAVFCDGRRAGYDLINIATEESIPLIRLIDHELWPPEEQIILGKYSFLLSSFLKGNRILKEAAGSDIIIIDEIGHLELRGEGFAPGLRYVLDHLSCPLILVVRESLLSDAISCFRIPTYRTFSVNDKKLLLQYTKAHTILKVSRD